MSINFNNIPALKKWGDIYLVPKLKLINSSIKKDLGAKISYSSIEVTYNDSIYNWLISTVTKEFWEKEEGNEINEIVLAITCNYFDNNIIISSDISFSDGEIISEIKSEKISLDAEINYELLLRLSDVKLNSFLNSSTQIISKGVKCIIDRERI